MRHKTCDTGRLPKQQSDSFTFIIRLSPTRVKWLMCMCDTTHSYLTHTPTQAADAGSAPEQVLIWMIWRIHMCDLTHSHVWLDSLTRVAHMWHTTHSYLAHTHPHIIPDTPTRTYHPWKTHKCTGSRRRQRVRAGLVMRDMTHSHAWHDSSIPMTRLNHTCDTTHACLTHTHTHSQQQKQAHQCRPAPNSTCKPKSQNWHSLQKSRWQLSRRLPPGIIPAKEPCIPAKKSCVYPWKSPKFSQKKYTHLER